MKAHPYLGLVMRRPKAQIFIHPAWVRREGVKPVVDYFTAHRFALSSRRARSGVCLLLAERFEQVARWGSS